jgi:bleomycin hydrolase
MGSTPSKPTSSTSTLDVEKFSSIEERRASLANLTLNDPSTKPSKTLDISLFSKWEDRLLSDPKNRLALNAFTEGDVLNIIRCREAVINDGMHLFSHKIEMEGKPITNQRSSGRCWLFASTNVIRVNFMKKYFPSKVDADLGINFQSLSFRNNICFFGINWRKQIVLTPSRMSLIRFLGMYD